MYILHNRVCSTCTANPQLHCFLIKTVCLRIGSIFQGLIFFLFVFVNDINAWILREPGYCGIWPSIRGSASFSCVICFLSLVFIQTSFLMKYFLECRQFIMIVTQMSHRLVNLLGLDIIIDFFSQDEVLYCTVYLQEDAFIMFILLHAFACIYTWHMYIDKRYEVIEPTVHQVPLLWSIFFFERDFFGILKILEYYRNLFKEI